MTMVTIEQWIEALESGNYEQAHHGLRAVDTVTGDVLGYCCLGVLCNLEAPDAWVFNAETSIDVLSERTRFDGFGNIETFNMPPQEVINRVGLSKSDATTLAEWNDSGASFAQIADALRYFMEHGELPDLYEDED